MWCTGLAAPPFAHFLTELGFLLLSCKSFLYILDSNPLSGMWFANIFSHSISFLLILSMVSFAEQKLFSLMQSHLFIFAFVAFAFGIKFKKSLPRPMSRSSRAMFSSRSFMVSGLLLKSLIHFNFYIWHKLGSSFILLHMAIQFAQHHLLKSLSFPHCIVFAPLSKTN